MLTTQQPTSTPERPPCWGRSYNNEDPGCLACMFRLSCRDEIIRLSTRVAPPVPSSPQTAYFSNYGQQTPSSPNQFYRPPAYAQTPTVSSPRPFMSAPSPVMPIMPARHPVMPAPPMQQQVAQQVQSQVPYSRIGWYGSIPDSMWGAVASVPPIFRPQMQGESFMGRLAKNTFLVLGEIMCRELMLAFRQATLPPVPPTAQEQVIDVDPTNPSR